jgi:enoyl-CoA hydratase/carnithine racemase
MTLEVTRDGAVLVAAWRDGENRVNLDSVAAMEGLAAQVEAAEGPVALVLTGEGKFFSNGLDLERYAEDADALGATIERFHVLLGRFFVLPAYAVAAVNGHAFAAGAMLTCAFDHRVMRSDRGYWCLNEAELGLPLTPPMAAAVLGRLPQPTALEAMLTARRFAGADAQAAGIVEECAPADDVLAAAVERAALVATKDRRVVARHKRLAFGELAKTCGWDG